MLRPLVDRKVRPLALTCVRPNYVQKLNSQVLALNKAKLRPIIKQPSASVEQGQLRPIIKQPSASIEQGQVTSNN